MAVWSEVSHKTAVSGAGAPQITAFDGTAADIIAIASVGYGGAPQSAGNMTSSPSNSFSMVAVQTANGDTNVSVAWYYIIAPSVNNNMTLTWTPAALAFNTIIAYALTQGSTPTFNTSGAVGVNSSGTFTLPSIGNANDLVLALLGYYTTSGPTISDGGSAWSSVVDVAYSGGSNIGLATAWKQVSGSVTPVWTNNSGNVGAAQEMAVSGTGGGGGGRGLFRTPPVSGIGIGGSFFRDPLQAREQMVRKGDLYVPERLAA